MRTPLYPTNATEEAADASLGSLREAVADEAPATSVAGALTAFLARWRRLDRDSPYRTGALAESNELLSEYCDGHAIRARQLLPEREKLASTLARQALAEQLREARLSLGLSVRQAAMRAAVAPSYLSELEGARAGLPSSDVAGRLDEAYGVAIAEVVANARDASESLRKEKLDAHRGSSARPETNPRLVEAMAMLRQDPGLLDVIECARELDTTERRAVLALMRELAA